MSSHGASMAGPAGSTAKVPAREAMDQMLPHLITFLLRNPQVKSIKQVQPIQQSSVDIMSLTEGNAYVQVSVWYKQHIVYAVSC